MKHIYSLLLSAILFISFYSSALSQTDTSWNQLPVILSKINPPVFPNNDFNILNYGAPTDGVSSSTTAIKNAINACNAAGGGRVIIPAGTFLTGAIYLKSNVNLYISAGATLKFSTNTSDYLPVVYTRFEGVECYNYSPFIYAYQESNIAITGSGTLDGQATYTNWWAWKTSGAGNVTTLNTMGQNGIPVSQRIFGAGYKIRPVFIQPYKCTNVLIDGVTILRSPMWEVNPVLCTNVTVSNLNINSHGPNNDGCNPECSKDVRILKCIFDTGDDCIAIKSGRNNDGRRVNVPSENIVIQQCIMKDGHGGITMGSECSGSIRNVFAEDCNLNSPNLDRALRIKTNSIRGGIIENIFMRNCTIGEVANEVIQVDMQYEEGDAGAFTPIVRNIEMKNVTGNTCPKIFDFDCYQRSAVSNIKIINCSFNGVSGNTLVNVEKLQIYNTFSNGIVPLIPAPNSNYIHAESYSKKSGWGWSNVLTGFSGNSYMEPVTDNSLIEWNISADNDAIDTIVWRYANIKNTDKVCSLYINSQFYSTITFPSTGSSWQTLKTPYLATQGNHTLRLVSKDTSTRVYIDRLSVLAGDVISGIMNSKNNNVKNFSCNPNLINYSAEISFNLLKAEYIEINLCSLNGENIKSICRGNYPEGENSIQFNRNHLANGIYMLRLRGSDSLISQKILIIN